MTTGGSSVLWILNSMINGGGLLAAAHAWNSFFLQKYIRLFWLIPSLLVAAWLEPFFSVPSIAQAATTLRFPILSRAGATNLTAYLILGFVFLSITRAAMKRRSQINPEKRGPGQFSVSDKELRQTLERFLAASDSVDVDSIATTYAPDFLCVRVADEGGRAHFTREQMLNFLKRATSSAAQGHSVPVKSSVVHHAEVLGHTALVLMTRVKDLGNGWEPLFYNLLWTQHDSSWRLSREFVHQKTIPNWW